MLNKRNKHGQIAIFIIVALVIVGAVIGLYVFRDKIFIFNSQPEFAEVYQYFDSCIKDNTLQGLKIAGTQGGYIETPAFEPGSQYAPFSSQFDFLGNPVPYWYYVSGNNIVKEQVPSKTLIEDQLGNYLNGKIGLCDFSDFRKKGYYVKIDNVKTSVEILNDYINVKFNGNIVIGKGNSTTTKTSHDLRVDSSFGSLYDAARVIYDKEKNGAFLENYSTDVLYSYAPVTGSELSCSPKIWNAQDVANDIKNGLSANIGALKVQGDYYTLKNKNDNYFVIKGLKTDKTVRFLYSPEWPTRVEIWPAENNLLIAKPVGLEQGMGIIGFCYVPYHFVYDVYYPVLIQVESGGEMLQFPVSVVIDKSVPRKAIIGESVTEEGTISELCNYKNTEVSVNTYYVDGQELRPVEANINFRCFNTECNIGSTKILGNNAGLSEKFPQCINGKITASADGFTTQEVVVSTNEPVTLPPLILDKLYELNLKLNIDGQAYNPSENGGLAVISFVSDKNSFTLSYPQQNKIKLSEGFYNISVQVFSGNSLTIPASTSRQCVSVPESGIMGMFGRTSEQCFDVNLPAEKLTNALSAGGQTSYYIMASDLKNANTVELSLSSLPNPISLDQLQKNYDLINTKNIGVVIE
jgi:hypothetical protein